jgi:protease-4
MKELMTEQTVMTAMWQSLLDDRKAERRRTYIKYGILGAIAALYAGAFLVAQLYSGEDAASPEKYAAMVKISGAIGPGESASAAAINPLLERAFSDKGAQGVVLVINSPGGTPVQSSLIHDRVVELKKKHNKKVVVVGEDMLTSGAYLIAVAADEIVVNRSTVAGSIGVISRGFGFTGLMDKLGVERRVMTAGESKNMMDPFAPTTAAGDEKQAKLLADIHEHFKDVVKAGRGTRLNLDAPGLFSGAVWTGEESVTMGLVDGLGDVKSAAQASFGTSFVKEFKPPKTFLDVVVSGIGASVAATLRPSLSAPVVLEP